MYKLERTLPNIGGDRHFIENCLIMNVNNEKKIKVLDLDSFDERWEVSHDHYSYYVYKNVIITNNLNFYNINKELLYSNQLDYKLSLSTFNDKGIAVLRHILKWEKVGSKFNITAQYHVFDLNSKKFIKQNIPDTIGGIALIQDNFFVISTKEGKLFVYDYESGQILWERDFSDEYEYKDPFSLNDKWVKATANKIYKYGDDKIIVKVGMYYTLCFHIKSGYEIWESKTSGKYIICNDIAYAYTNGGSIAKIDLKTGKILNKNGKFHKLPDLPPVKHKDLGDIHISASGNGMIYHDNALWYLVHSNGYSFVVKINPDTFEYEWIHPVDTTEEVKDIRFYKDKMYLYDMGRQLHIYAKVE